jgi:two-component system NtrC family sensor kinase
VREYLETDLAAKRVRLRLELAEGLPTAHTDRVEFEQVLVNVVKNAIDAVPGGGEVAVVTRAKNQRWLQVVVADNGPGIPPEQLERLFEPFFTTKEKGKGTGLGLFVRADHEEARRPHPRRERGGGRDEFHAGAAGAQRRPGDRG